MAYVKAYCMWRRMCNNVCVGVCDSVNISIFPLELRWCYMGLFLMTTFNALLLHKNSKRVRYVASADDFATFVAAAGCTTLNRFQFLTTLLQQMDCRDTCIDFCVTILLLKLSGVIITCIETCFLTIAAFDKNAHIQNFILWKILYRVDDRHSWRYIGYTEATQMYKCMNGLSPGYLADMFYKRLQVHR